MYENQPLTLSSILPSWLSADDFTLLAAGGGALLAAGTVAAMLMKSNPGTRRRIRALQERRAELKGQMLRTRQRRAPEGGMNLMRRVVNRLNLLKSSQVAQVQQVLYEGNWRSKDALVVYMFFTLVLPVAGLLLGLLLMSMDIWGSGKLVKFRIVAPVLGAYIGLKLPNWVARRQRRYHYTRIQRALADTLDLMTICAEAGLTLGTTLERVSRELGIAYPEMAGEMALTAMELSFLPERNKALQNLAERVNIPEIRGIVSVLIQTEKYGTPIAQALRVLSHEFREQRMLRAETKAARLPALMTVPMICFILPTLFIVILTPAIIKILDSSK